MYVNLKLFSFNITGLMWRNGVSTNHKYAFI